MSAIPGGSTVNSTQIKVYKVLKELQALKAKNQMK
jgi:hypothetical protein